MAGSVDLLDFEVVMLLLTISEISDQRSLYVRECYTKVSPQQSLVRTTTQSSDRVADLTVRSAVQNGAATDARVGKCPVCYIRRLEVLG